VLEDLSLQKVDLAIDIGQIQSFSYSIKPFFEDNIKITALKRIVKFKEVLLLSNITSRNTLKLKQEEISNMRFIPW
jgi:hypothetical protein